MPKGSISLIIGLTFFIGKFADAFFNDPEEFEAMVNRLKKIRK